jgi:hypothetical protein
LITTTLLSQSPCAVVYHLSQALIAAAYLTELPLRSSMLASEREYGAFLEPSGLQKKGIDKFVSYELPIALAEQRYGTHFSAVKRNLREIDELHVLDENALFLFDELGPSQ